MRYYPIKGVICIKNSKGTRFRFYNGKKINYKGNICRMVNLKVNEKYLIGDIQDDRELHKNVIKTKHYGLLFEKKSEKERYTWAMSLEALGDSYED